MITIKGVVKKYKNEKEIAYQDYAFLDGKSYIILGASGCGKSTLLNMICGVLSPNKGQIFIDETEVSSLSQKEKDKIRIKKIGYVYQDFKLIKNMSVMDNINILRLEGVDVSSADELLKELGIADKKNKKITNLSGGECQRVAIVRALVKKPDIILCDEPTGNLNYEIGRKVMEELIKCSKGKILIVVSHDDRLVDLFDEVIHMENFIVKEGDHNA